MTDEKTIVAKSLQEIGTALTEIAGAFNELAANLTRTVDIDAEALGKVIGQEIAKVLGEKQQAAAPAEAPSVNKAEPEETKERPKKRKRRTKAEIEAGKAAEEEEKGDSSKSEDAKAGSSGDVKTVELPKEINRDFMLEALREFSEAISFDDTKAIIQKRGYPKVKAIEEKAYRNIVEDLIAEAAKRNITLKSVQPSENEGEDDDEFEVE